MSSLFFPCHQEDTLKAIEMRSLRPSRTRKPERRRERDFLKKRTRQKVQVGYRVEVSKEKSQSPLMVFYDTYALLPVNYPGMLR